MTETRQPVSGKATMGDLATTNTHLPWWTRIGCYAWSLADFTGHARLSTGQLARDLGLSPQSTSNAIAAAKARGWLDPTSTARCLVLPGCAHDHCPEPHP